MLRSTRETAPLRAVLFSGGRGSGALTTALVGMPGVALTLAINGYDDGASTGEVRRFLGDALGPSDFRKNASRLASALLTCEPALVRLLDRRLPNGATASTLDELIASLSTPTQSADSDISGLPATTREAVLGRLRAFADALSQSRRSFDFNDCSVGNLVFAGGYLLSSHDFNRSVDDYCSLVGLSPGVVENVTDGTNAFLVALDVSGRVLGTEAAIVEVKQHTIRDIFLIDRPLDPAECTALERAGAVEAARQLESRAVALRLNPRLADRIAEADLIVYAPGTQHSSLFPSYLTPGLSAAIARNLRAIKLLITNIQPDAEIVGKSAVDIIERAVYYLKEKGRLETPTPALITHYLINDPGVSTEPASSYVPLGRLDTLEDPRLIRVGQYEEGFTGRHDALKVLAPFVSAALARRERRYRVAVLLYDAGHTDKIAQTLTEMARGGLADLAVDLTAFCETARPLDRTFLEVLPFGVREIGPLTDSAEDARFRRVLHDEGFEYLLLFESSGMYNGEDVPWLVSHLTGRLDAVWGSRRLSVRDIEESYRLKYRHRALLGAASYAGSHVLSLAYLTLYGRYVSDTLSGARAVRVDDARAITVGLTHRRANQHLLTRLLRRKAEMFEIPVHFYSLAPTQVRRTTVWDGIQSLATIVSGRFSTRPLTGDAEPATARARLPRESD